MSVYNITQIFVIIMLTTLPSKIAEKHSFPIPRGILFIYTSIPRFSMICSKLFAKEFAIRRECILNYPSEMRIHVIIIYFIMWISKPTIPFRPITGRSGYRSSTKLDTFLVSMHKSTRHFGCPTFISQVRST